MRSGTNTLPTREKFQFWSVSDKLTYIAANGGQEAGLFVESDRQWLLRHKNLARCINDHCGGNCEAFLTLHCDGDDKKFNVTKLKAKNGMSHCLECME